MENVLHNDQRTSILTQDSTHKILLPNDASAGNHTGDGKLGTPLIICFHGSGETCSPSWDALAANLVAETHCRVLLYNRGPGNLRPADVAAQMWDYVLGAATNHNPGENANSGNENSRARDDARNNLHGPYLLIAHSYGGAFARAFVQWEYVHARRRHRRKAHTSDRGAGNCVIGLVLVETGQEGGLEAALDEEQISRTIMGGHPVCVVRGNSLLGKWQGLEAKERAAAREGGEGGGNDAATKIQRRQMLAAEREMLIRVDAEDERLKRRQLGLSRTSRFVQLPDCGHHVVLQRPGDVVDAVRWVLENAKRVHHETEGRKEMSVWKGALERVRRFRFR